jgi:transcriptional regulator with XRE-family HTH domain
MRLKEIRESRGLSQRQAALGLNLSPTVYNRYENGTREPSSIVLLAMADYFGVTVDELLGREPETERKPEDEDIWELREQLRRDPEMRVLFSAASTATPEHLRAAAAMLKALKGDDFHDVD